MFSYDKDNKIFISNGTDLFVQGEKGLYQECSYREGDLNYQQYQNSLFRYGLRTPENNALVAKVLKGLGREEISYELDKIVAVAGTYIDNMILYLLSQGLNIDDFPLFFRMDPRQLTPVNNQANVAFVQAVKDIYLNENCKTGLREYLNTDQWVVYTRGNFVYIALANGELRRVIVTGEHCLSSNSNSILSEEVAKEYLATDVGSILREYLKNELNKITHCRNVDVGFIMLTGIRFMSILTHGISFNQLITTKALLNLVNEEVAKFVTSFFTAKILLSIRKDDEDTSVTKGILPLPQLNVNDRAGIIISIINANGKKHGTEFNPKSSIIYDLGVVEPIESSTPCRNFKTGLCKYGEDCYFSHDSSQRQTSGHQGGFPKKAGGGGGSQRQTSGHQNVPPSKGCHQNVPLSKGCHQNVPLSKGCHQNVPPSKGCHQNVPPSKGCHQGVSQKKAGGGKKSSGKDSETKPNDITDMGL